MTIEGISIRTRLSYNTKTNHIGFYNEFSYRKEYYQNTKDKFKEYKKEYYQNNKNKNKETQKEYKKEYYQNNKEYFKDKAKKYYENNSDKAKEYYLDNKDKIKEYRENKRDPNTSRIGSEAFRIKLSCAKQNISIEDFNGFVKEKLYCNKFDELCREHNRDKYNRKCFICNKPESENFTKSGKIRKLSVHHVDMNKDQGCDDFGWKLVPLCIKCHGKAHNDLWKSRIEYLLNMDLDRKL